MTSKTKNTVQPILATAALTVAFLTASCATRMTSKTYVGQKPGDPVKTTVINHTWWMGLPALAPMDASIKDGEFEVNSKAVDLPKFDFTKED